MVLVQTYPFFQFFLLGNIGQENVFNNILERKKRLSSLSKEKVKKVEKLTFFQGVNPWFWSKNGHFSIFFFLGNIEQENVFYDILERKKAFLGLKTRGSKSRKLGIFRKGLTHGFGPKMAILPTFFF